MDNLTFARGGKKALSKKQGFTLIEILVVIGIIAVLALIVLVAVNPARQFALARNTQRTSNVEAILNAVGQRMVDNKGIFNGTTGCLAAIPTSTALTITVNSTSSAESFDLGCLVPTYISSIPYDPSTGSPSSTGYTILADSNGRVTVCATTLEHGVNDSPICITR
jgi:prepilin-type N-terminal cleavage/methylation domain-containing protein